MKHELQPVARVALAICDGLASSVGLEVKNLITSERWDDLVTYKVHPGNYAHAEHYFRDVACSSFLKKYVGLPTSFDKKGAAVRNFWDAERKCFRTNQRLLPFIHGTWSPDDEAVRNFIFAIRKEVVCLLGERPPSDLIGRFGPGATFGDRGGLTTISDKMQSVPQLTYNAWPFLFPWSSTLWGRAAVNRASDPSFIRGNRFTTVPKDAEKDRGISVEPSINVFYQLAVGTAMRGRMKKRTNGLLDLERAQDKHRYLAKKASLDGSLATLDLKQASDTVAKSLVQLLLPGAWYDLLDTLRSPFTLIADQDGREKWVLLEKFSSMGNGFTFELETCLFLAVARAVAARAISDDARTDCHVFGDDIIVPTQIAGEVIAVLRYLGLEINEAKTFVDGPFRESCGGDYFLGVDVRPYFQKKECYEPQHFIAMANGIRRMALSNRNPYSRWPDLVRAWHRSLDNIPIGPRSCRGPEDLGDIVVHDDPEFWSTRTRNSIRYIRVYRPVTHRKVMLRVFDYDVQLAAALYGGLETGNRGNGNPYHIPRDGVTGYAERWSPYS